VTVNIASAAAGSDVRPVLRGALHGVAFLASLVIGVIFVAETPGSLLVPASAFAASAAASSARARSTTASRGARADARACDAPITPASIR
jgi:hypothetical protein